MVSSTELLGSRSFDNRQCWDKRRVQGVLLIWRYSYLVRYLKILHTACLVFKNRNFIQTKSCSFYSELAVNLVKKAQVSVQKVSFQFWSWRLNPASYRSQDIKYLNYSTSKPNWDLCFSWAFFALYLRKPTVFVAICCREWSLISWHRDYFVASYDGLFFWHIRRTFE